MSAIDGLDNDTFSAVTMFLSLTDLGFSLQVSRMFFRQIWSNEHLWRKLCERVWADKVYVPSGLEELSRGAEHVRMKKTETLSKLKADNSVKELKMKLLRADVNHNSISGCFEKSEFVHLLYDTSLSKENPTKADGSDEFWMDRHHYNPFMSEAMLVKNVNSAAFLGSTPACSFIALKLSIIDSERTNITSDELQSFTFNVRCRMDGPFAQLIADDPFWQGVGAGRVRFLDPTDGSKMSWVWPKDKQGRAMNPFVQMGMTEQMDSMSWGLINMNRQVQMFFAGQRGPIEVIARHPITWGWVLFSEATVWSSWEYTKEELNHRVLTRGIRDSDVDHQDPTSFYARSMAEMGKESTAGPW
ncbi:hypothetical protein TrVE_jg11778 [Triparma verrucosa]|uniref:F-box domain-containing protein n=1 Tax=Triparma verrucosa TaxID=1606542 RepID=A0A9W7C994_9STRA|nr:hypothetical protein TrVE_jg11778 [Triparma verrucosa]